MTERVAIIDPGSGNLASVTRALDRAAAMTGRAIAAEVTRDPDAVARADRVILPGQGAFAAVMTGLDAIPGMLEALATRIRREGRPLLGICVGMQVLAARGLEHGVTPGLGWITGDIAPMDPRAADGGGLPLPQMGWNTLRLDAPHPVLAGIAPGTHAYFVHSYALQGGDAAEVFATADYGGPVAAVVGRDTLVGTQFHVEKSHALGLRMLANFLGWRP